MIIGCVQPKRSPAKAARTFMALLLATLKNEHAHRAGVRRHDQMGLLAQCAGQARPDTGVENEIGNEIARGEGIHPSWIAFRQRQSRKYRAKTLAD